MRALLPGSLQGKLIAAFVVVVVVALAVAGVVFVSGRNAELRRERLNRVALESAAISTGFALQQYAGASTETLAALAREVAAARGVRILLVDAANRVAVDSADALVGETLEYRPLRRGTAVGGPFVALRTERGAPGSDLILLAQRGRIGAEGGENRPRGPGRSPAVQPGGEPLPYELVLAVPASDLAGAWRGLIRGLLLAALIALPVAVLLAVLFARYVTRPLRDLTAATHLVAEGRYDIEVASDRRDEIGQLSRSFGAMTARVGAAQSQMRALVADVSHNLKTPLTSILGFSRALETGEADDPRTVQRMGRVIHDEAQRLAERLEDLLLISELESGGALLQRAPVDIGSLVTGVARRVFPEDASPQPELAIEPGVVVQADGAKLERLVENLLQNARAFTPAGGAIAMRSARRGAAATIEVTNTAPGIDPDELPRLFDRFYRREAARAGGTPGTGLGLAIARDIAGLHGGTLDASLAGDQVTFTLALPSTPPAP